MFGKILIANRGEIACRVIKTARKMGIKTVAVYSEADARNKHVRLADEAVCIGPAPSKQSYLNMDAIMGAIQSTGAEAVHPGYGFLSENSKFVALMEKNNIAFIGPPSSAMEAMGDKINSKKIAKAAGVQVIPGFIGEVKSEEDVVRIAREIGYPVMIKASAGGGGKGMRLAHTDAEAIEGFRLSKQEAASAFGDDRMLVEKFIKSPRHIEIQVLGDKHGNVIYLPERECSIQRRNQKVLEEAPSSFLDPATRRRMGEEAVMLAKAVGYYSAGTVEMLVDDQKNHYQLEMNTRLQVEHPVTEEITGLDLVQEMIRVAAGHPLSVTDPTKIEINGWAMEARVYAEDPARNFLPSIGILKRYEEPVGESVRCDSGITEGAEISIFYDPMICKLITHGKDRPEAMERLRKALDGYVIQGVTHNIPFLREVLDHPDYIRGDITTKWLEQLYPKGFAGHKLLPEEATWLAQRIAAIKFMGEEIVSFSSVSDLDGSLGKVEYVVKFEQQQQPSGNHTDHGSGTSSSTSTSIPVTVERSVNHILVNGKPILLNGKPDGILFDSDGVRLQVEGRRFDDITIRYKGTNYMATVLPKNVDALSGYMPVVEKPDLSKVLVSPMPGTLISVAVKKGDRVLAGQELAVVEAMKMRNILRSQTDGVVKTICVEPGKAVAVEQVLVEFE